MNVKADKMAQETVVPTCGEVFGKDSIIEIVRSEARNAGPRLLTWNGKHATLVEQFTVNGVTYVPLDLGAAIGRALLLPARATEYGSTRQLFNEIATLVSRASRLPNSAVILVAAWVFATWFADRLQAAPVLWITSSPTDSAGPLLQALALLSRRALLVTEPTVATLRSLPMQQLRPMIVTEVSTITPAFLKALRASNRRGTLSVVGNKAVDLYCPKIVVSHQPLRDPAQAGFPLEIALPLSNEHIPQLDAEESERLGSEFQAKLLMYRLLNWAKVTAPDFDLGEYTAPTRELAHTLAGCIVDDKELQGKIVSFLRPRDREIQVDRTLLLESIVIEGLWAACHDSRYGDVSVTDLTKNVNSILQGRGESQEVSPETVGWKLRGLGLRTDYITGGRKGLQLPSEIRVMIHNLAEAYGVRTLQQGGFSASCSACTDLEQKQKKTA
jgi:hypothetical protein